MIDEIDMPLTRKELSMLRNALNTKISVLKDQIKNARKFDDRQLARTVQSVAESDVKIYNFLLSRIVETQQELKS